MKPVSPPESPQDVGAYPYTLFLAGTIDMGNSEDWQTSAINWMADHCPHVQVYNPRRADWDSSWSQTLQDEQFFGQVAWEHYCFTKAKCVIVNFVAGSASPITLLELGILAATRANATVVVCPPEYYRAGNVEFICRTYNVAHAPTLVDALQWCQRHLSYGSNAPSMDDGEFILDKYGFRQLQLW